MHLNIYSSKDYTMHSEASKITKELMIDNKCCLDRSAVGLQLSQWVHELSPCQAMKKPCTIYLEKSWPLYCVIKGTRRQCHKIFDFGFFSLISFSQAPEQSIPLGPFRSSRCTNGVVDTGFRWKESSIRKILIIFIWTPLSSRMNF